LRSAITRAPRSWPGESWRSARPWPARWGSSRSDTTIASGIRGPIYGRGDLDDDKRFGFRTIRATDVDDLGVRGTVEAIAGRVEDLPVYLSLDIDVLDPAFAPGTGTPEAGGLSNRELLRVLRGLTGINLVGCDVVEVAPAYDHGEITAIAAATVVFDLITLLARKPPA